MSRLVRIVHVEPALIDIVCGQRWSPVEETVPRLNLYKCTLQLAADIHAQAPISFVLSYPLYLHGVSGG